MQSASKQSQNSHTHSPTKKESKLYFEIKELKIEREELKLKIDSLLKENSHLRDSSKKTSKNSKNVEFYSNHDKDKESLMNDKKKLEFEVRIT